eukprot:scaffold26412_cov19-Tisochrysis_lutea.AAC.1
MLPLECSLKTRCSTVRKVAYALQLVCAVPKEVYDRQPRIQSQHQPCALSLTPQANGSLQCKHESR